MRRRAATLGVAAVVVLVAATAAVAAGTGGGSSPGTSSARGSSPLAGQSLYRDPRGHVPQALATALADGTTKDVDALRVLDHPTGTWLAGQDDAATARRVTVAAADARQLPVLVLYNIPDRDCGSHSSGGAATTDDYLAWVRNVAAGVGDRPALLVLEPDAVPQAVAGCDGLGDPAGRYAALAGAMHVLSRLPHARTYLDAGNAGWVQDSGALVSALRASGLDDATGFALNVSNFRSTSQSVSYGRRLAKASGTSHFVIDTSRNGASTPTTGDRPWCNPPTARRGQEPTTDPHLPGVDALLWIKQPGDSDGSCHPGDPPAGTFSLDLVHGLIG